MKPLRTARSTFVHFLTIIVLAQTDVFAQTNFTITPSLALQASFPSLESYQYQAQYSTDLANWFPASGIQVATGTLETLTFGMTNGPHAYYRVQQSPPNLSNRIVGLSNIYFDNAVFTTTGNSGTIAGFRAVSSDYNLNDYLKAGFQFDLALQTMAMTNIQVSTNLGPVCGQSPSFFINNATEAVFLTNGASVLSANTSYSITSTGQTMVFNLQPAQSLSMFINTITYTNMLILTGPNGFAQTNLYPPLSPGYYYYVTLVDAIFPGAYTLRFVPEGTNTETLNFSFHNRNALDLVTLTNGMNLSTSITSYYWDYAKFQVNLNAGQTLSLGATGSSGTTLALFNYLGVKLSSWTSDQLLYTVPSTGVYYVIYYGTDLAAHSYSTTVSITP